MKRLIVLLLSISLYSACTGEVPRSPVQQWNDVEIAIESRPPLIQPGMNEFLIIANRGGKRPAANLIVSLRTNSSDKWTQAIQDGHVGVYRRAMRITDPNSDHLLVQVRMGDDETILDFPLSFAAPKR